MQKRTKKKALLLTLGAVMLVAVSVLSTIAFLKSIDSVNNTFTVGKVEITLDEAKVSEYGVVDATASSRVKANVYKLIPGHYYVKDPTVHFAAGSEESYLFVKVENGLSAIEAESKTIESQIAANGWTALTGETGVYYKKVNANTTNAAIDYAVFGSFTLAEDAEVSSYSNAAINVTAYGIQADGFDTAEDAWENGEF